MKLKTAIASVFMLLVLAVPCLAVAPSPLLPLDHWAYAAIDRLSGRGLIVSVLAGSRPWTRIEAARLIDEAGRAAQLTAPAQSDLRQLEQLQRELARELRELGGDEGGATSYVMPLRVFSLDYNRRDGSDAALAPRNLRPGAPGGQIAARQWALDYNANGRDLPRGSSASLTLGGEARLGWLLAEWRPQFDFVGVGTNDAVADSSLAEGRVVLQLGAVEISAGRQALWWGQGRHGSLLLTNNAHPLDMVRLTNSSPALLPWVFSVLGPVRFDLFWSRLEATRVVPEPYLAGLRLNLKPLPWFELGAARTVIFGGKGKPKVDAEEFVTILGGKNRSGGTDNSNSIAALDGRLRLPFLFGAELYGEYGGEDEAGRFLANTAWLAGVALTRLEPSGRLGLRVERSDLSRIDDNSPLWYRHGIYKSGYTYRGKVLGHHVGGGGDDLLLAAELQLPANLEVTLALDIENRGADQAATEGHRQWSVAGVWRPSPHLSVRAHYAWDEIENRGFIAGRSDRQQHLALVFASAW